MLSSIGTAIYIQIQHYIQPYYPLRQGGNSMHFRVVNISHKCTAAQQKDSAMQWQKKKHAPDNSMKVLESCKCFGEEM